MSKWSDAVAAVGDFAVGVAVQHVDNMIAPIEAAAEFVADGKLSDSTKERLFNGVKSAAVSDLFHDK